MTFHHILIFCYQELAAHRETTIVTRFRNTGFLQQRQRRPARTDEHKFRVHDVVFVAVAEIGDGDAPASVRIALDIAHFLTVRQREIGFFLQRLDQLAGYLAEVDVGACGGAGGCHFLRRITAFHDCRDPLFDLFRVF